MQKARRLTSVAMMVVLGTTAAAAEAQEYWSHDELGSQLRALASSSDRVAVSTLGASHEGRDVWLVTVASPDGAPLDTRPGLMLVANLEGDHLVGSTVAVEAVRHLLAREGEDEDVQRLLRENVIYLVPRLNPDGAEAMFAPVRWDRKVNAFPYDDDNDGRVGEDGPDDLNGDGMITFMRVADPAGDFLPHPDDPRLMKRADPAAGEKGTHTLYHEGLDNDGDGFFNEDGVGGVDLNRNFQHAYPYWEADAGLHMVSEPETRALMDFMVAHRNIAAILTFGHTDNLVTPPDARGTLAPPRTPDLLAFADAANADLFDTGVFRTSGGGFGFGFGSGGPRLRGAQPGRDNDPNAGRRPATTVNGGDLDYFATVSRAYREITGVEEVGIHRAPSGAFFEWGYFQFGVPSFSATAWHLPSADVEEEEEEEESPPRRGGGNGGNGPVEARLLASLDGAGVDAFVEWTPFQHPSLGEVEIGGFRPHVLTNPPAEMLGELGATHGDFLVRLTGMLPRVRFAGTEVTAHGGGVFTVEATVENTGYFPTALQHGVVSRAVDPVMVQLQVEQDAIVTGDDKTATVPHMEGSGARQSFSWVIRGNPGDRVEIRLRAQKGGTDTATVTLR